jgi:hypothetical protein
MAEIIDDLSSGILFFVVWEVSTVISEEPSTCIFRVKEVFYSKHEGS